MHKQRISILLSAIVGIIATFLPFMKSWIHSVSLIETKDATVYIVIAAFVITLILTFLGNIQKAIVKGHLIGAIFSGIIPVALLLLIALSKSNDSFANTFTNFEIGFYIIAIASVSILIFGLTLADKKTQISGTNQNNQIFCSKCGKQYSSTSSGEFCEACGNKLN